MISKFTFSYILFLFSISIACAQLDRGREGFSIKPSDSTLNGEFKLSYKFDPQVGLSNKNVKLQLNIRPMKDAFKKTSGVDITAKSTLVQKEWEIKQKFSEDSNHRSKYMRDYFLGDLKTSSPIVVIMCRDHEYVDGDRVKLMLNKSIIHPNIHLNGDFYAIDVDLKDGFNTISFTALNEGSSSPNTAQLKIFDKDGKLLASKNWNITTGHKASLMILKE
ncbi:MAG: hypothetical protein HRT67_13750 [Flavobacteriaceae bacterium]|nr:hypothetical protein [Flavobacteriaceae bacterium]